MFFTKTPKLIQRLFPSLTWKINSIEKEVFITFDDGPTPEFTQWLLNLLYIDIVRNRCRLMVYVINYGMMKQLRKNNLYKSCE